MPAKIAFATFAGFPDLTDDDRLAANALVARGVRVDTALWDDPAVNWRSFDSVIIRSTWDYHLKPEEFRGWLEQLASQRVVLWNPLDIVRWNLDKSYLNDLRERGVPVLDTIWASSGEAIDLHEVMARNGWGRAVVKPRISAAANGTEVIALEDAKAHQDQLALLLEKSGAIVQDFAEEIQTSGEWSLVFFNKRFSHAVLKRPRDGDFRVQRDFGGTAESVTAPQHLVVQAQKIVDGVADELLYARVDGIDRKGILYLMELELIEPHLFFELYPQAADTFATALLNNMKKEPLPFAKTVRSRG